MNGELDWDTRLADTPLSTKRVRMRYRHAGKGDSILEGGEMDGTGETVFGGTADNVGMMAADYRRARGAIPWDGDPLVDYTEDALHEKMRQRLALAEQENGRLLSDIVGYVAIGQGLQERLAQAEAALADVMFAAHMPDDYEFGLPSWVNQHLYGKLIAWTDVDGRPIRRSEDVEENIRLRQQLAERTAERDAMTERANELMAAIIKGRDFLLLYLNEADWFLDYKPFQEALMAAGLWEEVQEDFFDAVRNDETMTPERKAYWLAKEPMSTGERACEWSEDKDGVWFTSCGEAHQFTVDGPAENHYSHCSYCGKRLQVVMQEPEPIEDEEAPVVGTGTVVQIHESPLLEIEEE